MTLCGVCNNVGTYNSYVPTMKCKICSIRPNTSKLHSSLKAQINCNFSDDPTLHKLSISNALLKNFTDKASSLFAVLKKNEGWDDSFYESNFVNYLRLCKLRLPQTVFYTFLYWFKVAMTMLTIIRFIILHCEVVLYMTLFTCFLLIKVNFILLPFLFFTN